MKMWNYNNGQILKRMYKENVLETSDIAYIEMVYLPTSFISQDAVSNCYVREQTN